MEVEEFEEKSSEIDWETFSASSTHRYKIMHSDIKVGTCSNSYAFAIMYYIDMDCCFIFRKSS